MRGLLVATDDEPSVVSKRNWNQPQAIAYALRAQSITRVQLPPAYASHIALFLDDDQRLTDPVPNLPITALLDSWSGGQVHNGTALFIGLTTPHGPFDDLSLVSIWRLALEITRSQRRLLAAS